MKQLAFNIIETTDCKIQFTDNDIIITVDKVLYSEGKHHIHAPLAANAHFICRGKKYSIENTEGKGTVEDWYLEELLPKFQMLSLLLE